MSHPQNTQWLEAAQDNLDSAIDVGNYPLCLDIIADTKDAGFDVTSMKTQLQNTPISKFTIKSPYA